MTRNPKQRLLITMALSLVGAALAAGNANAERPDDRPGMLGVGAVAASSTTPTAVPDAFEQAEGRSTSTPTRPDDRSDARGPGVYFSVPALPASVSADDFAWGDAPAGAGAMLGVILLAAGLAVSIRNRARTILH